MENKNSLLDILYKISNYYYILLPVIVFLIYFGSINYGFVKCDDYDLVVTNHNLIDNVDEIPAQFQRSYMNSNYYRPMINLSFLFNSLIGGTNPAYYHLFNIILHSIAVILLFIFLVKLGFDKILSFLSSIIFAVHPLFVNAVAWIPGRNDLVLGIFILMAFIFLIEYLENDNKLFLLLHFLALLFAFLSKETALLIPIIFLFYIFSKYKNDFNKKQLLGLILSWIISFGIWFGLRMNADLGKSFNEFGISAFIKNLSAIPEILAKAIIPLKISVLATYSSEMTLIGIAILLIIIFLFFVIKTKNKTVFLMGVIWFLLFIIPGMFVRRLNANDWNDYLECRSYLPVIGIFIFALSLINKQWLKERISIVIPIFAIFIIVFSGISISKISNYKNPYVFYESVYRTNPDRGQFDYQFAKACLEKKDYELAEKALKSSIRANANYGKYYYNLGVFYFNRKNFDKSEKYLDTAIQKDPLYKNSYVALTNLYLTNNQLEKARAILEKAYKNTGEIGFIQKVVLNDIHSKDLLQLRRDIEEYKDILLGNEELANLMIGLGVDLFDKGEKNISENLWQLALEIDSNNYLALDNLFQYYLIDKKDFKTAKIYADKIEAIGKSIDTDKKNYLEAMLK